MKKLIFSLIFASAIVNIPKAEAFDKMTEVKIGLGLTASLVGGFITYKLCKNLPNTKKSSNYQAFDDLYKGGIYVGIGIFGLTTSIATWFTYDNIKKLMN